MKNEFNGYVVKFSDNTYFVGIKGRMLKTTTKVYRAKIMSFVNGLTEREKNYLNGIEYKIIEIKISIEELLGDS